MSPSQVRDLKLSGAGGRGGGQATRQSLRHPAFRIPRPFLLQPSLAGYSDPVFCLHPRGCVSPSELPDLLSWSPLWRNCDDRSVAAHHKKTLPK